MPSSASRRRVELVADPVLARLAPRAGTHTRFVIAATMRSGSELLVGLLDSNPAIRCEAEIVNERHPRLDPVVTVEAHRVLARLRGARAFGFKMLTSPIERVQHARAADVVPALVERGYQVVALRRRDHLAQAVSLLHARHHQRWHWEQSDRRGTAAIRLEPAEVLEALEVVEEATEVHAALTRDALVSLVYEDDLIDGARQQATADRVCTALGVPPALVTARVVKVGSSDLADRIENYDEVVAAVAASRFTAVLDLNR